MTDKKQDTETPAEDEFAQQREEIAEVDRKLDEESDGEGLGAEAGRAEENGISEG